MVIESTTKETPATTNKRNKCCKWYVMQCDGEKLLFFDSPFSFAPLSCQTETNAHTMLHSNDYYDFVMLRLFHGQIQHFLDANIMFERLIYGVVEFRCKCEYESHGHVSSAPEWNVSLMFDYNFDIEFFFFLDLALAKSVCLSENKHNLIYRIRDVIDFDFIYNVHSLLLPRQWVSCVLMERKSLRVPKRKKKLKEEKHGKKRAFIQMVSSLVSY